MVLKDLLEKLNQLKAVHGDNIPVAVDSDGNILELKEIEFFKDNSPLIVLNG